MGTRRLVVGITGASGTPLALHCLQVLNAMDEIEVHLIATEAAKLTAVYESDLPFSGIEALADVVHDERSLDAALASGTFPTLGMLIVPCSMKTVAGIASGYSDNLLLRAADVTLKEQRPLVLAARETPLSPIHLRNLETLSRLPQVHIVPPMLTYYTKPKSIHDMEHHLVGKLLAPFGIEVPDLRIWTGTEPAQ
ncbi:MAG: UbiX family flavin prenyltransferase [Eggerthellaceae bacterium]